MGVCICMYVCMYVCMYDLICMICYQILYVRFWFLNHLHEATGRPVPPFYKKLFGNDNGFGYKDKYFPCAENNEDVYLSRPDVQSAIHAKRDAIWTGCSTVVRYNFSDSNNPMEPIWQWLTDNAPDVVM